MRSSTSWILLLVGWVFLALGWAVVERGLLGVALGIFLTLVIARIDRSSVK